MLNVEVSGCGGLELRVRVKVSVGIYVIWPYS